LIELTIPGRGNVRLAHAVLDVNEAGLGDEGLAVATLRR
jgi:hypothetical protein